MLVITLTDRVKMKCFMINEFAKNMNTSQHTHGINPSLPSKCIHLKRSLGHTNLTTIHWDL